ncbi:aminotransferase class V-fold PLP-dependent enzyme [Fulvivirga sp. 29W222]|uniref:Aminotransferase class V-fold PLP-dependent enzyme n=1 Tax=Fulvivirga marina TaxID=2494733 RepID=A0A937FUP3_9BACT|nr:aminotransferase class V-fold PLP-dependent enzyme [Fulvivirga marina]MBL6444743.1 aminotransferase class V-fold PLP-dependent enzyme [Fulvivirga marina]
MNIEEFKKHGHAMVDWIASYYENVRDYPVKSQVKPGEVFEQIADKAPERGESMDHIFEDFREIIMPGITHWQSPNFYAYFPANTSFPSLLGDMLASALGSQCMIWDTSPAAAELEEKVMVWLRDMLGLPSSFSGVIQDTASTATLCALITAREKLSNYQPNSDGLFNFSPMRVYCSTEVHSSVEKAVKIMGMGKSNLVKIGVDEKMSLNPKLLKQAIEEDIKKGYQPLAVVAAIGSTGTAAIDPLSDMAEVCEQYGVWLHVDAAYAGSALILEEYRWMIEGIEKADSFVFNPHKWLMTNFDCSAYFVKDEQALIKTFSILPEYLKTNTTGTVKDYRDWGIQLGRRFRSLKLWFVIRSFGVEGIKSVLRNHIRIAENLSAKIREHSDFEELSTSLNLVCFRYKPEGVTGIDELNRINKQLIDLLNESGKMYLTHTKIGDNMVLRLVAGQTNVTEEDVLSSWSTIQEIAAKIKSKTI